jgi:hypothetical protein
MVFNMGAVRQMAIAASRWWIHDHNAMLLGKLLGEGQHADVIVDLARPANHPIALLAKKVCIEGA